MKPLLLFGLLLLKLKFKKLNLAFFDGDTSTIKGRTVMQETLDSVKMLKKKGLKVFKLSKSFIPVQSINPWIND